MKAEAKQIPVSLNKSERGIKKKYHVHWMRSSYNSFSMCHGHLVKNHSTQQNQKTTFLRTRIQPLGVSEFPVWLNTTPETTGYKIQYESTGED